MDLLTFILLVFILCVVLFIVYYFFRGQKGNISLSSPVESRVDEYLDRRFQSMVDEWELVSRPKLQAWKEQRTPEIEQNEARLGDLKNYESGMQTHLTSLEARLDTLEKELDRRGSAKK